MIAEERRIRKNKKRINRKRRIRKIKRLFSFLIFSLLIILGSKFIDLPNILNLIKVEDSFNLSKNIDDSKLTWNLVLVNKNNKVPRDYEIELIELSNGVKINLKIYEDLQRMMDEARLNDIYPIIVEGYRSYEEQEEIMNEKVRDYINEGYSKSKSKRLAKEFVAFPGTSEHELGIAVDINGDVINSTDQEVYSWLALNSYKYGFILRYPPNKTDITGISYEPWHYRYVGFEVAEEIYNRDITLEEYLD